MSSIFAEATVIDGLTIKSQFNVDYTHTTGFGSSTPSYAPNLGEGSAQRLTTDGLTLSVTKHRELSVPRQRQALLQLPRRQEGLDYHYEDFTMMTEGQNNDRLTNITSGTRLGLGRYDR